VPYPAGYDFPLPFGRSGIRFSIHPSPAGDLGLPRGRLTVGHTPADPIGVSTFRMRKRSVCGRGGCLLYAEVFGVLKPESSTNSGANATTHHRLNQGISMTCCSFDASQKIHLYVHPSDLRLIRFARLVRASPWSSPAASHRSLAILHAPDGDGIEHYPGSIEDHFTHATSCRTGHNQCSGRAVQDRA
jgi:hypothetical protein